MERLRIGLLFGGQSDEHEVSIRSAQAIAQAFQQAGNADRYELRPTYIRRSGQWEAGDTAWQVLESGPAAATRDGGNRWQLPAQAPEVDVWFPILHGPNGEDGTVQGLLTLMQAPFVGSGVLGSALGMDKLAMKVAFAQQGLPQLPHLAVRRSRLQADGGAPAWLQAQVAQALGYPCFVKPANLGSSVGISKVRTALELDAALATAARHDRRLLIEAGTSAREVECAVLGNDDPQASVVGEIAFSSEFYDYRTKYTQGQAQLHIPASLPEAAGERIRELALQAFGAVDAADLARVDFFYSQADGTIRINEINTLPGFTATSMYPQLWAATGVPFPQLVDRLVQLARERHGELAAV